jgi:hypothetical protein
MIPLLEGVNSIPAQWVYGEEYGDDRDTITLGYFTAAQHYVVCPHVVAQRSGKCVNHPSVPF